MVDGKSKNGNTRRQDLGGSIERKSELVALAHEGNKLPLLRLTVTYKEPPI